MIVFAIKSIRVKKNVNLYQLSKHTGLTRSYLRDLENNKKHNPTLNTLEKIAKSLEVKVKDLFYERAEINSLKQKLNEYVEIYGINSKEVLELSQIIDLFINLEYKEKEM